MRAPGITSYYNRVTPAYKSSRNRPVKREDKPLHAVKELPVEEKTGQRSGCNRGVKQ
jgi:hypothetical protein